MKIYDLADTQYFENREIESFEYTQYEKDGNTTNQSENATYNFTIEGQNNFLYSDGFLQVESKIVKQNGDSIGEENVTFVNTGGLIDSYKLLINDVVVEQNNADTSLMHHVLFLINFTPDYSTSEPTNMLFFPDTSDKADRAVFSGNEVDVTKLSHVVNNLKLNENYNKGFALRCNFTKNSNVVTTWFPLKYLFSFFNYYKKVIPNSTVKIEIQRNSSENMIYTTENNNYKVVIENVKLWLPHIKFKNDAKIIFEKFKFNNEEINIKWNQYRIVKSNSLINSDGSCHITSTSDDVLGIYVIPQYIEREKNAKQNNMIFDNLDMIECGLMINNIPHPYKHYEMDFPKKAYNRLYSTLFKAGKNYTTDTGNMISYSDFGLLYPIICFDLSNHENYTSLENLRINFEYKLRNAPGKEYRFYFILEERKVCKLNVVSKKIELNGTINL